jgi:hypothetical protein
LLGCAGFEVVEFLLEGGGPGGGVCWGGHGEVGREGLKEWLFGGAMWERECKVGNS